MSTFRSSDDKLVTISYIGDASFNKLMGVLGLDLGADRTHQRIYYIVDIYKRNFS